MVGIFLMLSFDTFKFTLAPLPQPPRYHGREEKVRIAFHNPWTSSECRIAVPFPQFQCWEEACWGSFDFALIPPLAFAVFFQHLGEPCWGYFYFALVPPLAFAVFLQH